MYSGDTGFYSGAAQLLPMLRAFGISCRVLPGLSSVQLLAACVTAFAGPISFVGIAVPHLCLLYTSCSRHWTALWQTT